MSHISIDSTVPLLISKRTPANSNDWNGGPLTVSCRCVDQRSIRSGSVSGTLYDDVVSTEGQGQSVTSNLTCLDATGNVAQQVTTLNINIDLTRLTINAPENMTLGATRPGGTTVDYRNVLNGWPSP